MQVKDANKKRRDTLVLAGVCLLLHLAIAPQVRLGSGCVNFALVFVGVMALSEGGKSAVVAGFLGGLLYDLTSTTPVGLMALLLTIFAYVLGIEERNRFGDGIVSSLTSFGVGSLCVLLAYNFSMFLLGETNSFADLVLLRTVPSFALTFLAFLPFAYLQSRGAGKPRGVGGGSSSAHRGSHYDVSNL